MKTRWLPGLVGLFLSVCGLTAQTAHLRLTCYSLRFHPAENWSGDTFALTSLPSPLNGELFPYTATTYASNFRLGIQWFDDLTGSLELSLPDFVDANDNGFDDFFEVAQGVANTTTSGTYGYGFGGGTLTAQWSRAPGSKDGTCMLALYDSQFGDIGSFTHVFEVLEYTGPLTYTPGDSNVVAEVNLTQTGAPENTLRGPALFSKTIPGNPNRLVLRAGAWTNSAAQTLSFVERTIQRDTARGTNYYGYVGFDDGDPNTSGYDYPFWELSIDDANDGDHNGIPDFSDAPTAARRPTLSLQRGASGLLLTISGDVGRLHHILTRTNLTAGQGWQTNFSVTLTSDPQTVALPVPPVPTQFWQAVVP